MKSLLITGSYCQKGGHLEYVGKVTVLIFFLQDINNKH